MISLDLDAMVAAAHRLLAAHGLTVDGAGDNDRIISPAITSARDVLALADALRTLAAQHAGDVAAAVAGERERAVAVCRAVADGWERASTTAKVDTGLALIRAEGATECADAIAAPTGGGE